MNLHGPLIQPDAPSPLMTVKEAAVLAGRSVATFYRFLADAPSDSALARSVVRLPGHQMLIRRRQLELWLTGAAEGTFQAP